MCFFRKKSKDNKVSERQKKLLDKEKEQRVEAEKNREKELEYQLSVEKHRLSELREKLKELKTVVENTPGSLAIGESYNVKVQMDSVSERINAYETELTRVRMNISAMDEAEL